jgi:hypothetical protein
MPATSGSRATTTALAILAAAAAPGRSTSGQEPHWALTPPTRHVPQVANAAWCRDDIDRCVLAGLERAGLQPSPAADPELLLRRLHLVLTGLPPTLPQRDAFLADATPDAYERVVDALLADPACAEHLAVPWLDLARFADTYGYQSDFE